MRKISLYKPYITSLEKKLVNVALDTGWISSRGSFVDTFEKNFAKYTGRKHAISVCNGTCALHLALEALGLPKGSAIICPSLTYVSTANAIRYAGLVPIFVDCDKSSISRYEDFEKGFEVAKKNSLVVSAIMPVHLYGRMPDVNKLKSFGVPIIEDCAESFGSNYEGNVSGSFDTEFSVFSFFGNKTITTGEGGMIVCNDDQLYKKCVTLRGVGQTPNTPQRYHHVVLGYNYRMTNIAAAIGVAQLENSKTILEKKLHIANRYKEQFAKSKLDYILLPTPEKCKGNEWLVTINLSSNSMREGLILYLESQGIETRPAFLPMHVMVNLGKFYRVKDMFNSETISACGINLPSHPELSDQDIDYICYNIVNYISEYND